MFSCTKYRATFTLQPTAQAPTQLVIFVNQQPGDTIVAWRLRADINGKQTINHQQFTSSIQLSSTSLIPGTNHIRITYAMIIQDADGNYHACDGKHTITFRIK